MYGYLGWNNSKVVFEGIWDNDGNEYIIYLIKKIMVE